MISDGGQLMWSGVLSVTVTAETSSSQLIYKASFTNNDQLVQVT